MKRGNHNAFGGEIPETVKLGRFSTSGAVLSSDGGFSCDPKSSMLTTAKHRTIVGGGYHLHSSDFP